MQDIYDNAGTLTQQANEALFDLGGADVEDERDRYLTLPENFLSFQEELLRHLRTLGLQNNADACAFVKDKYKAQGIPYPAALNNWLKGTVSPQGNTDSRTRENMFMLCFALGFDVAQTDAFFHRAYMCRSFDCRRADEATILFCMKNKLPYSTLTQLAQAAAHRTEQPISPALQPPQEATALLRAAITDINKEEAFLEYLQENTPAFQGKNRTAYADLDALVRDAKRLTKKEVTAELFSEMLGVDLAFTAKAEHRTVAKNTDFVKLIRQNFPTEEQFKQIESENASYDTLRKMLILFKFYVFFKKNEDKSDSMLFYDFVDECADLLENCGFPPLYSRNPFDWLFLHCAACIGAESDKDMNQPLGELNDILQAQLWRD